MGALDDQPQEYRDSVLPLEVTPRFVVKQNSALGWEALRRTAGYAIGMKTFGASALLKDLQNKLGSEPDRIVAVAKSLLGGR
ncbi:MAG: hypothetical protein AB7N70_38840 [Dehalococcoidia bacterium]